jgi:hypothetical protein
MRHIFFTLAVTLLLTGCMQWPASGQGGVAEFNAPGTIAVGEAAASNIDASSRLRDVRGRLTCETARLQMLEDESRKRSVMTGQILDIEDTRNRALREYSQGLLGDADITLDRMHSEVAKLAPDLVHDQHLPECSK